MRIQHSKLNFVRIAVALLQKDVWNSCFFNFTFFIKEIRFDLGRISSADVWGSNSDLLIVWASFTRLMMRGYSSLVELEGFPNQGFQSLNSVRDSWCFWLDRETPSPGVVENCWHTKERTHLYASTWTEEFKSLAGSSRLTSLFT